MRKMPTVTREIHSANNPAIKRLAQLEKPRARRTEGLFVIEGLREIRFAWEAGYEFHEVFRCKAIADRPAAREFLDALPADAPMYDVSRDVFAKIAYRENVDGLIVVARTRSHELSQLRLSDNPFVLALETVEKPGNLGAMLRTADAVGVDAVIVCDPQTDIYNPNVVRASLGCLFSRQIAVDSSANAQAFLAQRGIIAYAAAVTGTQPYHRADFTRPCAIVMGSEAFGLSEVWLRGADAQIIIPMLGKADSLNVSTSAAILLYEARRQRGF